MLRDALTIASVNHAISQAPSATARDCSCPTGRPALRIRAKHRSRCGLRAMPSSLAGSVLCESIASMPTSWSCGWLSKSGALLVFMPYRGLYCCDFAFCRNCSVSPAPVKMPAAPSEISTWSMPWSRKLSTAELIAALESANAPAF